MSYWESIVPQTEWTQYYLPAEAILAIPSQGIIVPVNYPKEDGLTDPNDEVGHLKYLDMERYKEQDQRICDQMQDRF